MSCAFVSGMVQNVLLSLEDSGGTTWSSGKVESMIFKDLPVLNGLMGSCFSGDGSGCIAPSMTGTIFQGVLEALVAKDLVKGSMITASRNYSLTSFQEGDSKVTMADNAKSLSELYKNLNAEFDKLVNQAKYTIASQSPSSVIGTDAAASVEGTLYRPVPNYYPNQN